MWSSHFSCPAVQDCLPVRESFFLSLHSYLSSRNYQLNLSTNNIDDVEDSLCLLEHRGGENFAICTHPCREERHASSQNYHPHSLHSLRDFLSARNKYVPTASSPAFRPETASCRVAGSPRWWCRRLSNGSDARRKESSALNMLGFHPSPTRWVLDYMSLPSRRPGGGILACLVGNIGRGLVLPEAPPPYYLLGYDNHLKLVLLL